MDPLSQSISNLSTESELRDMSDRIRIYSTSAYERKKRIPIQIFRPSIFDYLFIFQC